MKFSKLRYISLTLSFTLIVLFYWLTFEEGGFARSLDFDGGLQLELEFPAKVKSEFVRKFFMDLKPSIKANVIRISESDKNIFKIEAGKDVIIKLEGEDRLVKEANSSLWNYVKSFIPFFKSDIKDEETANTKKTTVLKKKDKKIQTKQIAKNDKSPKKIQNKKAKDALVILKDMVNKEWNSKYKNLGSLKWIESNKVGPSVGLNLRRSAVKLLLITMLFIIIYLTFRFEFRFGVAALVALLHDLLMTWGLVGVLQMQPSIPLVAALLTILGYSINDTIVIFDRIRENMRGQKKINLKVLIDNSINQSLSRTLVTSLTTLVSLVCIYTMAGSGLRDFSFTLIAGIFIGTYSSVFIASPVLIIWDSISKKKLKDMEA